VTAHLRHAGVALLIGLAAFVLFFIVGSIFNTRNDTEGMVAYCVAALAGAFWMVRRYPKSIAYAGIMINIPAWALLAGPADPGQFKQHLVGLIVGVISAYVGSLLAAKLFSQTQPSNTESQRNK
jgi:hypothetical protein